MINKGDTIYLRTQDGYRNGKVVTTMSPDSALVNGDTVYECYIANVITPEDLATRRSKIKYSKRDGYFLH